MSHAGNWSRNPAKLSREAARLNAGAGDPWPGWFREPDGTIEPIGTITGCLARGAVLEGRCRLHPECTRRVQADLGFWVRAGLGDKSSYDLHHAYLCARPAGCQLRLQETYPGGAPLQSCANEEDVISVEFRCEQCRGASWSLTPQHLIEILVARGRGDGNTGLLAVGKLVRSRKRCAACGPTTWVARVRRKDPLAR